MIVTKAGRTTAIGIASSLASSSSEKCNSAKLLSYFADLIPSVWPQQHNGKSCAYLPPKGVIYQHMMIIIIPMEQLEYYLRTTLQATNGSYAVLI